MPEIEIFEDKSILVGKRRKGKDESIEDAMKTMERFADWLALAPRQNPWTEADVMNTAMLYGMLDHLRREIDTVIALGGDEAQTTFELFKGMKPRQNDIQDG
mgnify:CR=1 FL=1